MKITNYVDDDIQFTQGHGGDDHQITPDAASNEDLQEVASLQMLNTHQNTQSKLNKNSFK